MTTVHLPDDVPLALLHRLAQEYGLRMSWDVEGRAVVLERAKALDLEATMRRVRDNMERFTSGDAA